MYVKRQNGSISMWGEYDEANGITEFLDDSTEEAQALLKPITDEASKLTGVEILGVMCSATRDDQNGLTAIGLGVTMARSSQTTFPSTVFKFSNGNELTITNDNFDTVYATWVPFRQSFFSP